VPELDLELAPESEPAEFLRELELEPELELMQVEYGLELGLEQDWGA
jgi:hypothetical protein